MPQERRESFRCPVPSEKDVAILRTERSDIVVLVLDESASGMGVLIPKHVELTKGQTAAIASSNGCSEVCVAYIEEVGGERRAGLTRVRDIDFLPSEGMSGVAYLLRRMAAAATRGVGLVVTLAACFALAAGSIFFLPKLWEGDRSPQQERELMARRFLDLDSLSSVKVTSVLKLTRSQKSRIVFIVEDTTQGLAALYEQRDEHDEAAWSDMGIQLIRASWEQVDQVLTDEQKANWDAILAD